ncbi:MAG: hypothetical protein MJZ82_03050 [Paludibacteraceae bacterium]|nr:hypothetical protein [Paludibacteraceae bacterium]
MKRMILCAMCLTALCATAQVLITGVVTDGQTMDANAIAATQNGTTDWYMFGQDFVVTLSADGPVFPTTKAYNTADGDVVTIFGYQSSDDGGDPIPIKPIHDALPEIEANQAPVCKYIHNGRLIIDANGKRYGAVGF